MGTQYTAIALIGMRANFSLYQTTARRVVDHDFPEHFRFDPATGAPLWIEETKPIDGYDPHRGTYLGLQVVHENGTKSKYFYFPVLMSRSELNGETRMTLLPGDLQGLETKKLELFYKLQPVGKWDPQQYGLWSFIYYC